MTVASLRRSFSDSKEILAVDIVRMYDRYNTLRQPLLNSWKEQRDYTFATDTRRSSDSSHQWRNSTTIPKLCQLRDNLYANYMAALYPNDDWLMWIAQSKEGLDADKAKAIVAYMKNKLIQQNFRKTLSKFIYDYIDYGNVISEVDYVRKKTEVDGERVPTYTGPIARRVSPYDMVFDPTAESFEDAPKITRDLISIGELKQRMLSEPDNQEWMESAIIKLEDRRSSVANYRQNEVQKASGYVIDGFGNYSEYLESGYVEVHNFEGSIYCQETGCLLENYIITVVDRDFIARKVPNPSWIGQSRYTHVGWRDRPDNLYGMSPLENVIGMQYRIDHVAAVRSAHHRNAVGVKCAVLRQKSDRVGQVTYGVEPFFLVVEARVGFAEPR